MVWTELDPIQLETQNDSLRIAKSMSHVSGSLPTLLPKPSSLGNAIKISLWLLLVCLLSDSLLILAAAIGTKIESITGSSPRMWRRDKDRLYLSKRWEVQRMSYGQAIFSMGDEQQSNLVCRRGWNKTFELEKCHLNSRQLFGPSWDPASFPPRLCFCVFVFFCVCVCI